MKNKNKKVVIIGTGETADIAYEYFTHDSDFEVIAFAVDADFIPEGGKHLGLPVFDLAHLDSQIDKSEIFVFVAISYNQLNRVRKKIFLRLKNTGFKFANYISSKAFVWHNVKIGENVMVLENNVIQYNVQIGNNVIIWSGNHIGHQTIIESHVYIASHAVISGFCHIGESCFIGVNATFNDKITVEKDCIIGSGAVVTKNTKPNLVYVGNPAKPLEKLTSYQVFKVSKELVDI
ncbi:MAG: acetyltransferase [Patescibacteria group bacterium]|nr:acetyltransferase [Patescibacteria group bacterium]